MQQTTSLLTKVFKSSFKWMIESFTDYSDYEVNVLTSDTVRIEGTRAEWIMYVYPNGSVSGQDKNCVTIELIIKDKDVLMEKYRQYKIEVKAKVDENKVNDKFIWNTDYEKISNGDFKIWTKVIEKEKLSSYLHDGNLTLAAKVWLKTVETLDVIN